MWVVVVEGSRFELDVLDEVPTLLPVRRPREEEDRGKMTKWMRMRWMGNSGGCGRGR